MVRGAVEDAQRRSKGNEVRRKERKRGSGDEMTEGRATAKVTTTPGRKGGGGRVMRRTRKRERRNKGRKNERSGG